MENTPYTRASSTLTTKYQATIPLEVRGHLNLRQGDKVICEVINDQVLLRRAIPTDHEYLASVETTFSEWASEIDDIYNDL